MAGVREIGRVDTGSTESKPLRAKRGPWKLFYAWTMTIIAAGHDAMIAERKRALLGGLHGTVVEVGPGTGPNLAYYPPDVRWIGVEPNGHMNGFLEKEARRLGRTIELHGGTVEALPFAGESVDHVVSTLVFCSVDDQARALREVWRVLKPGGRFVFIEHVAAAEGTALLRFQSVMAPAWRLVADGCRPDRRTWEAISGAGFSAVEIERFHVSAGPFGPHIAGYAVK